MAGLSSARRLSPRTLALLGSVGLLSALLLGVVNGSVSLSLGSVWQALLPGSPASLPSLDKTVTGSPTAGLSADQVALIVQQLRLPRVLLAACIGALLAVSGAVMQGLFRNPLADPSLIGVTAGAIAGASLVIVFGSALAASELWPALASAMGAGQVAGLSLVSLGAFIGGALTVWLVYRLASTSSGTSVSTMLLAGIAITALAGSLSSLLEFYADNAMLRRISVWRMGGLDGAGYHGLLVAALCLALVLAVLPRYARALNLLLLGESEARHLGVDVERLKLSSVLVVALAVGVSVALAGSVAFIGLIVPHIVRLLAGPDHRVLLPLAALAGALLLVLADCLARTLIAPAELPLGVITALLGAPFFISLLRSRHQYGF